MTKIIDKKQIVKICELTEELPKKIKGHLNDDELKFFLGCELFNIKLEKSYVAVRISKSGDIEISGFTINYELFENREIKWINKIDGIEERIENAIENAKDEYRKSLGKGAIAIQTLQRVVDSL